MIEKVNPSHPDKVADRVAGAIVDLAYAKEPDPKIAVEVLIGHGTCHVIIETTTALEMEDVMLLFTGLPVTCSRMSVSSRKMYISLPTRQIRFAAGITASSRACR